VLGSVIKNVSVSDEMVLPSASRNLTIRSPQSASDKVIVTPPETQSKSLMLGWMRDSLIMLMANILGHSLLHRN